MQCALEPWLRQLPDTLPLSTGWLTLSLHLQPLQQELLPQEWLQKAPEGSHWGETLCVSVLPIPSCSESQTTQPCQNQTRHWSVGKTITPHTVWDHSFTICCQMVLSSWTFPFQTSQGRVQCYGWALASCFCVYISSLISYTTKKGMDFIFFKIQKSLQVSYCHLHRQYVRHSGELTYCSPIGDCFQLSRKNVCWCVGGGVCHFGIVNMVRLLCMYGYGMWHTSSVCCKEGKKQMAFSRRTIFKL